MKSEIPKLFYQAFTVSVFTEKSEKQDSRNIDPKLYYMINF
jgi:hypothetical protein